MSDTDRSDLHPDSPPSTEPDQLSPEAPERRTSVEGVEEPESPLDGAGIEDGVGGTGGVNKAQDKPAS